MTKKIFAKLLIILLIGLLLSLSVAITNVKATTSEEVESTLNEMLNSDGKIMEYDIKTKETREVDMEELRRSLSSSSRTYGATPSKLEAYDPMTTVSKSKTTVSTYSLGSGTTAGRVLDTSQFPYRVTCRVEAKNSSGKSVIGSAALVGPQVALTAAHCVFDEDNNNAVLSNWTCYPGYNNGSYKGYSTGWSKVYFNEDWKKYHNHDKDWAICVLEAPLGSYLGYFGAQSYGSNSELNNTPVKITGYPGDTSYGYQQGAPYQYESGDKINSVTTRAFTFSAYTVGGFSGGPVRRTSDNYIVGVFFGATTTSLKPTATRITQEMIDIINSLRQ